MSYRIVYGNEPDFVKNKKIRWRYVAGYTVLFLFVFGVMAARYWPGGLDVFLEVILPGDPALTRQAMGHMVENLRSGEAIGDVVAVFCREIVDGAQLSH